MHYWKEELALTEAAAIRIEKIEAEAEQNFDRVYDSAEARGDTAAALKTQEFDRWLGARADTDEAWGRWASVMNARPAEA